MFLFRNSKATVHPKDVITFFLFWPGTSKGISKGPYSRFFLRSGTIKNTSFVYCFVWPTFHFLWIFMRMYFSSPWVPGVIVSATNAVTVLTFRTGNVPRFDRGAICRRPRKLITVLNADYRRTEVGQRGQHGSLIL